MPSFNAFTKLNSIKNSDLGGSPRDRLRQLASSTNSALSILDEFAKDDPNSITVDGQVNDGARVRSFSDNAKIANNVFVFPEDLGSQEYPAWVQITMYERTTLADQLSTVQARPQDYESQQSLSGAAAYLIDRATGADGATELAVEQTKQMAEKIGKYNYDGSTMTARGMICLPMQSGMGVNNVGVEVAAEEIGSSLGQMLKKGVSNTLDGGSFTDFAKKSIKAHVIDAPIIGNALQISTGKVTNPYSFQMFKGVKHRSFPLTFNLVPLSMGESFDLKEIIDLLQDTMLPQNDGYTFSYPMEFTIEYMMMDSDGIPFQNPYYPKSGFCFLATCTDSPNEQVDSVHIDGAPVSRQVQLDFIEIEPYDKAKHRSLNTPPRL